MGTVKYRNENGDFTLDNPELYSGLYLPMASEKGLKSVITPDLSGDSKIDQNHFLFEPASIEDLRNRREGRNFWCCLEDGDYWSVCGNSAEAERDRFTENRDSSQLTGGFMWQKLTRVSNKRALQAEILSFVPYNQNFEVMEVTITNQGKKERRLRGVAALPIFGRSADNLRDHRHVTSLLHRIRTSSQGIEVKPTLSFDERGHQKNTMTYYVVGRDQKGQGPVCFYPTIDLFLGEGGSLTNPQAVRQEIPGCGVGEELAGCEAMGAFSFEPVTLASGESATFIILAGITDWEEEIHGIYQEYTERQAVEEAFEKTKSYWQDKVNISFETGNKEFDAFQRWVCFQPILRRIYGCSFLPHHDYGRGGRGWRDLWQDCLALLIMDPSNVRSMILDNFRGVRVDGTNATIIGEKQGEFKADRNGITRVWMDHGMWPFMTTKLYLEQTGDLDLLLKEVPYFSDRQVMRGEELLPEKKVPKTSRKGTVLEHLILQHVGALCETGEHGILRLRDADWNDALDMASARGESVAFSCAYAGNLKELAAYIKALGRDGENVQIAIMSELATLIQQVAIYPDRKKETFELWKKEVSYNYSGEKSYMDYRILSTYLEAIGDEMISHIRDQEWTGDAEGNRWINSYYDNHGNPVEGEENGQVRMMLTGQVFAVMSGVVKDEEIFAIVKAAERYLYKEDCGGYRLNTDFKEEKYDMGRAFGFAYGHKENGAVFSHMAVMYANALYQRGFVVAGYKAMQALADAAMNFEKSHIYPGIPEYFDGEGRGLYHYLTGAASWYALTMVTQVFGVRGQRGDLRLNPQLLPQQLDESGKAGICLEFAGKKLHIIYSYENPQQTLAVKIKECRIDGVELAQMGQDALCIPRETILDLGEGRHTIEVTLV